MSEQATHTMTPEEILAYRNGVEALVADCLERIRAYPLKADVEPTTTDRSEP
jgi:hypothetical protein